MIYVLREVKKKKIKRLIEWARHVKRRIKCKEIACT